MLNANKHCAAASANTVVQNEMQESAVTSMHSAMNKGTLLSKRDTNQPDMGTPINELTGINSKMVPNAASLRPKVALMVGIREAQVEKQTPDKKKNTLKKKRCLVFNSMPCSQFRCEYLMLRANIHGVPYNYYCINFFDLVRCQ